MSYSNLLKISFLGRPSITLDEERVTGFISDKAVALLSYLVLNESQHARETLAGLLWGEFESSRAKSNLRQALHNLQKLLPDYFEITRKTVRFRRERPFWLDVFEFEKINTEQHSAVSLQTLVSLYQDDFLTGLYVDNSPDFEAWQRSEQERLRLLLLEALSLLSQTYHAQKNWSATTKILRQQLTIEPWQETAHRQLMMVFARQGQIEAALAQYQKCHQILADELNVSPTHATIELAARMNALRQRPQHNLPPQPTPFIGREAELTTLTTLLAVPENRLVTIVAPGGMGKTRLALATAASQTNAFLEGVAFVALAPLTSSALLATTIVETLASDGFIDPHQGHKSAADYLIEELANKELLLILDNYEQLLPDISLILAIMDRAPQVKMLVTSRERLHVRWERAFSVDGLPYPLTTDTQDWQAYSAPQLFLQTAQQVKPEYIPTNDDQQAIVQICQLVEGMPLALELAATWVRMQTPTSIEVEIRKSLLILNTHQRDQPIRQRSMIAIFDQTWARLARTEERTLAQLSVFRGLFTLDAAYQVTGANWQLVTTLVDKSLLRQRQISVGSETAVYYEMHELLRQYASGRLEQHAESNETKREHSDYYAQLLTEYEPQLLDGITQDATLKLMQREMDNIRAAWDWALSTKQGDNLNQMLESLYRYYFLPALVSDGQEVMADAAAQLAQCHNKNDSLQLAYGRILGRQGGFVWLLHEDYQTAERLVRHSISILEECAPGIELAQALKTLANIIYTGDLKTARQYWQRSLEIHEQNGHLEGQATLLRNLCVTSPTYSEMLVFWEKALKTAVSANDRRNEGHLYFIRGNGEFCAGYLQVGQELAQKSIEIIRTTDDPPHLILALNVLADIFISKNKLDDARLLLGEMQEIEQHLSIKWHSQLVAIACGRHAVAEKCFEEAENYLTTVLSEISEEGSYKNLRQLAFFYRGQLKLQQGDYVVARNQWQQCCDTDNASDFVITSRRWRAMVGIGESWLCEGEKKTAVMHFQQARDLAVVIGAPQAWQRERTRLLKTYPEQLNKEID